MEPSPILAAIRFGLGPVHAQALPADPMRWLQQQIVQPDPGQTAGPGTEDGLMALQQDRAVRMERKDAVQAGAAPPPPEPSAARALFRTETHALLDHAVATEAPFRERLVWFWANHFTVSIRQGDVAALAGAFVREAIRPHVTGRFSDMLLAVMRHPAMLLYLDNAQSAGPNSPAGLRQHRGLNENLARECLELHTVSPAARYTQADVTSFAALLTGWSVERQQPPVGFRFRPPVHEPGDKVLMGRTFPEGEAGGQIALAWLAEHPATHRHLATKLVRHFVSDQPPPDAVRRIEAVLHDSHGNLGQAALALTALPSAWSTPLGKLRSPQDYIVAALRAAALPPGVPHPPDLPGLIGGLGQPPFNAPFPIGWPDTAAEWAGPEAMLRRVDWAYGFAGRPELPEPMQLAEAALGPLLSDATANDVRRAGSRREAITLLLASPEFQRR